MILHIDHVTVVVRDVAKAKAFFSLLGFVEEKVGCHRWGDIRPLHGRGRDQSRARHAGVEAGNAPL